MPMTLEEAQAEILRLEGELATANQERENLTQENGRLNADLQRVRDINQDYFLRLKAQTEPEEPEEPEEEPLSCEDFAKSLNI